eukprot:CAMPEP_0196808480 /NCGR_PEP_ID=MMETSP1362-20130617/8468_1 /TAXON_ID=163516 /ORGANISM="Leptocylindrus danicus, Strain CCMP1856" /LENGTH=780 /DNA_ID=CAMNT_0042182843 /DNA_START=62 /DNA_END=2404 /DNA_ORIENTATION=-
MKLLLTSSEQDSYQTQKVLTTASYCSIEISKEIVTDVHALPTTAKGIALELSEDTTPIGQTNAMIRALANMTPSSKLYGKGAIEESTVDAWLGWIFCNVETALNGASLVGTDVAIADVLAALDKVDAQLAYRTYLVGEGVTLADISLTCVLKEVEKVAGSGSIFSGMDNLSRWYQTMLHQPAFASAGTNTAAAIVSTPLQSGGGLSYNGVPPSVVPKLYNRGRIRIKELLKRWGGFLNQQVTVGGWARTLRNANKGKLIFLELNDGSTGDSLQCVLDVDSTDGFGDAKNSGGSGSSYLISGEVVESPGAEQAIELKVEKVEFVGPVYGGDPEGNTIGGMLYPMSKKSHTLEHLREHAHLRARSKVHAAAMRIRNAMAFATHKFFNDNGFLYIHTPIVTCADCEGAGEQFGITTLLGTDHHRTDIKLPYIQAEEKKEEAAKPVPEAAGAPAPGPAEGEQKMSKQALKRLKKQQEKEAKKKAQEAATKASQPSPEKHEETRVVGAVDYANDFFGRRANLTVSGQLNVETHCCALSDVYTFGPTFRAENSHTTRHLCEFWMIEPEIAFADLARDIDLAEDYLKYCVQYALEVCADDLEFFETHDAGEKGLRDRLRNVLDSPFVRLTYTEAIDILKKAVEDGVQFEVKPEWGIDLPSEHERYICEKVYKQPVVLTDYPKGIKAFYMKLNDDGKTVAAADVLVPKIGEIIGGSQREHRKDVLVQRCLESGLETKHVWWYLDLRKYGTIPHAGFGLGFERLILFITGLDNIRDVIPFPRWPGNAEF